MKLSKTSFLGAIFALLLPNIIWAQCSVSLSATPSPACKGRAITFNTTINSGGAVAGYSWAGSNGYSGTTAPATAPANEGTYTYTVTVSFTSGCTATATTSVNVWNAANGQIQVTGASLPLCAGETATVNLQGQGGNDYAWAGPNGFTSNLQTVTLVNPTTVQSGNYTVTVTGGGNFCSSVTVVQVGINNCYTAANCNSTSGCFGGNLVQNGDFEQGNTAFTSAYTYNGTCIAGNNLCGNYLCNYGYAINNITTPCNPGWSANIRDHTTTTGNFMIVDFPTSAQPNNIWCQTVNLMATTNYCMGGHFINLLPINNTDPDPIFQFSVNGNIYGSGQTVDNNEQWQFKGVEFTSTTAGNYTFCITNKNYGGVGFDVGIDDITVKPIGAGSPPITTADNVSICTGQPTTFTVLGNDTNLGTAPTLSIAASPPFNKGSVVLNANNTFTFTPAAGFTSGSTTFSYQVCNGNCCTTQTVTISFGGTFVPYITPTNPTICAGSNVTLSTNPGFSSYAWSNGAAASNAIATSVGTYTVTVSGGGCTGTTTVVVAAAAAPTATASSANNLTCTQTNSLLTATGGGTYLWSNGGETTATKTVTTAGTYTVTVTNTTSGCTATSTVAVTGNTTIPTATASSANNLSCSQTTTLLTATGGGTYLWSNGGQTTATKTVTTAGTYTVTVTNTTSGCTAISTVTVTANTTTPTASASSANNLSCLQTTTLLTATGGGTYLWSNGGQTTATKTASTAGIYTVTVTNTTNGCTSTSTVTVTANTTTPTATASSANNLTCTQTSSLLTATGGGTYLWSNGGQTTATKTVTIAGTYTVTVTNTTNGCTATSIVTVTGNNTTPTATATSANNLSCLQTSSLLTATGGGTYLWSNGGQTTATKTVTTAGTYTVTVTNTASGCTATSTVTVTGNTSTVAASATSANNLTCALTTTTLTATGGGTYLWSNGGETTATKTVTTAGTYTVTVTNTASGCSATSIVTVTTNTTAPTATITSSGNLTCVQNTATLTATPATGVTYAWSGGGTNATKTVTSAGTHIVTVTSTTNGCTATASIVITRNVSTINATAAAASSLSCTVETTQLSATPTTGVTYLWSNAATTATTTANTGGVYTVTVTNPTNGCTASTTVNVVVTIPIPTGIFTFATNSTSSTIGWTSVTVATSYCLDYRITGTTNWTTVCNILPSGTSTMNYTITGLYPGTQYQVRIRTICGTTSISSTNSAIVTFTTTTATNYCPSAGTNSTNHYINNVAMGAYSNTSGNNNGYANFTATTWSVAKGFLYGLSVTPNYIRNSNHVCYKVWIDWNRDNDFSDATELVGGRSISSRSPFMMDITIPATVTNGITRMRVSFSGDNCVNACTPTFATGEVEDYTLNIINPATARETNPTSTLKVYPNPTQNEVFITTNGTEEVKNILIFDAVGKLIQQINQIQSTETTISLTNALAGLYVLEIELETGEKIYQKLIKE